MRELRPLKRSPLHPSEDPVIRELVAGIVQVAVILVTVWSAGALVGLFLLGVKMVAG